MGPAGGLRGLREGEVFESLGWVEVGVLELCSDKVVRG
jgi:hypothetical protein